MEDRAKELYEYSMEVVYGKIGDAKGTVEKLSNMLDEVELKREDWSKLSMLADKIAIQLDEI